MIGWKPAIFITDHLILIWEGNSKRGHYLDKGFNVKFIYRSKNINIPNIAIGLDDFAGTGFFTREYVVATNQCKAILNTHLV